MTIRNPVCVCYFVLLYRYWGIVTFPGSIPYGSRLGVAGFSPFTLTTSLPILVLSSSSSNGPSNCSVDNHGLVPWRLHRLGGETFVRTHRRGVFRCRTGRPGANPIFNHFEPQMTITQEMVGRRIRTDDLRNNSPSLDR